MIRSYPKILFLSILLSYPLNIFTQNINYQVKISELKAKGDQNDGGGFFGSQDPTWFISLMDNGTTASSLLNWQNTGCIHTSNFYDVWWTGNPTNGPSIPHSWLSVSNTDATMVMTEIEGWEDDCGSGCNYNPNPSFWSSCFGFGDQNKDGPANSGNINIFTSEKIALEYKKNYKIGEKKIHILPNYVCLEDWSPSYKIKKKKNTLIFYYN